MTDAGGAKSRTSTLSRLIWCPKHTLSDGRAWHDAHTTGAETPTPTPARRRTACPVMVH